MPPRGPARPGPAATAGRRIRADAGELPTDPFGIPEVPADPTATTPTPTPTATSQQATEHAPEQPPEPTSRRTRRRASSRRPRRTSRRRGSADPRSASEHAEAQDRVDGRRQDLDVGHGHGHPPPAAGRRVRLLLAVLLVPCALAALVLMVLLRPSGGPAAPATAVQPVHGDVTAVQAADCTPGDGQGRCAQLDVRMTDGPRAGATLAQLVPLEPGTPRFTVGDPVVLGWSGGNPDDPASYQVVDFQRSGSLLWLAGLFAAAVIVLGRWRGLAALAAMVVSFAVLLLFVLPAILDGRNPLAVAVVGAGVIMFAVLYLTHGFSARTSTAVFGTLASLALIGVLGVGFSAAARLTGLDDQTTTLVASLGTGVDARGLLLAGIVIGALGVLDDVTVTQTSAVWELRRANPLLGATALFRSAMRIGRDHAASAVNTLVLAYAGAALPLLLLFSLSGRSLLDVATSQDVATEIVRTLVGSIGLVASVPITTAVAALVASREVAPAT